MTPQETDVPNSVWKSKALSFLVRTRQELWGKHNEDVLAWFFLEGFRNSFIRDMLLGWNRFAKHRPSKNWGLPEQSEAQCISQGKFILPPGIVIPSIVNKELRKLLIYDYLNINSERCISLPGSSTEPIILGYNQSKVAVVSDIIHGLLTHQEHPKDLTVIIPDTCQEPPDERSCHIIRKACTCWIFPDPKAHETDEALKSWAHISLNTHWAPYEKSADIRVIMTAK